MRVQLQHTNLYTYSFKIRLKVSYILKINVIINVCFFDNNCQYVRTTQIVNLFHFI